MSEQGRQFFRRVSEVLEDRERLALDMRFGVTGPRSSLAKIGEIYGVTRERARQYVKYAREQIGEEAWRRLEEYFPAPVSESAGRKEEARRKSAVRDYVRHARKKDTLQYAEVHELLGVPIPEHRGSAAFLYDLERSCLAFMEDYGIKHFGWMHYCAGCDQLGDSPFRPLDEFYRNESRVYQFCRRCNTDRCVKYFREHAEEIAAKQRARVAANPEAAREATKRYQERRKLGIKIRPRRVRAVA